MRTTPMFPLGTVALPGATLALRIFEPRYQQLLNDVLEGDRSFGVVLIERGSEVGGGEVRSDVGTLVRIEQHQNLGDGEHAVVAIGVERIRVLNWLPDSPYPQAETTNWPDEDAADPGYQDSPSLVAQLEVAVDALRTLITVAGRRGYRVAPLDFPTPPSASDGSLLLSALLPVGPFDKQRLLRTPSTAERLQLIVDMAAEQSALLAGDT